MEKDSLVKQRKNFNKFKESYHKQYVEKKNELKKILHCEKEIKEQEKKEEEDSNAKSNSTVELELSNLKSLMVKRSLLTKFPNSILAACFNGHVNLPKRNGKIFIDREAKSFTLMLNFIKSGKLPKFINEDEEKLFFEELNYWGIKIPISKQNIKFDINWSHNFFHIDKSQRLLTSSELLSGIVFVKRTMTALTPYFEFTISFEKEHSNNKKIIIALVDPQKFTKNFLSTSFEKDAPFYFYWDPFNKKAAKSNLDEEKPNVFSIGKYCCLRPGINEVTLGIKYNHDRRSVELYSDGNNLGVVIENILPGLTPAIEIRMEECRIQLSNTCEPPEKIFL